MSWWRLYIASIPALWIAGVWCIAIWRDRERRLQARASAAAEQAEIQLRLDTIANLTTPKE